MNTIQEFLDRLQKVKKRGEGEWSARCPAHHDIDPSLNVKEVEDGRVLVHCFSGCAPADIMAAVGMSMQDLFPGGAIKNWIPGMGFADQRRVEEKLAQERTVLAVAAANRKRGIRLSPQDLKREREAYSYVREHAKDDD